MIKQQQKIYSKSRNATSCCANVTFHGERSERRIAILKNHLLSQKHFFNLKFLQSYLVKKHIIPVVNLLMPINMQILWRIRMITK